MSPLVIPLPGNEAFAEALAGARGWTTGALETRNFPDGETYLRFAEAVEARSIVFVCTLPHPDPKFLPLWFAAETARALGATKLGLVAPYLAYMRQDKSFRPGEAVTSRHFAKLISEGFDWLVTVDPHLHRYRALSDLYTIPARALHADKAMAAWIAANVPDPLIVGPDAESEQWVSEVAKDCGAPYTVMLKTRHGDRDVSVHPRDLHALPGRTPVIVDDIVASGETMLGAIAALAAHTGTKPVCVAVHAVLAEDVATRIAAAGARFVSTDTIPHASNAITVVPQIAEAAAAFA